MARSPLHLLSASLPPAILMLMSGGCGASMHAVYEGDVRFEHCMALDAETHVRPSIRRACWAEWVGFYTYGQTRDRVLHAHLRMKQLGSVSDSLAPPSRNDRGVIGAPDAGSVAGLRNPATVDAQAGVDRNDDDVGAAGRCTGSCDREQRVCSEACGSNACTSQCVAEQRSCLQHCM